MDDNSCSVYYFCCWLIVHLCGLVAENEGGNDNDDNDDEFMINGGEFGMVGVDVGVGVDVCIGVGDSWIK